jgi:hypothetical protein
MPNIAPPVGGTDVNDVLKPDWGQWPYASPVSPPLPESDAMTMLGCTDGTFWLISANWVLGIDAGTYYAYSQKLAHREGLDRADLGRFAAAVKAAAHPAP